MRKEFFSAGPYGRPPAWYLRAYQDHLLYFPLLPENATTCVPDPSEWGFRPAQCLPSALSATGAK